MIEKLHDRSPLFAKSSQPTPAAIRKAAGIIRKGGLVIIPTETVYGLAANALDEKAVERIFLAKNRPKNNPLIVHIHQLEQVYQIAEYFPQAALKLAANFWPGPLTLVLPRRPSFPSIVTAGLQNVAVRMPAHPVARRLLRQCRLPVAAPSANLFGEISPTQISHVSSQIRSHASMALNGGPCRVGIESTVISFVENKPVLLRPGGLPLEAIESCIGSVIIPAAEKRAGRGSPGQIGRHYAPGTPMVVISEGQLLPVTGRFGVLRFSTESPTGNAVAVETLSADLCKAATDLFASLKKLDEAGLDLIVVYPVSEDGFGRGIMDRLIRGCRDQSLDEPDAPKK